MQILYTKTFNYLDNFQPTHLGIYFSLLLHLSIILFAVGLPDLFKPKIISVPQIIPIEILNVTDVTSLTPKKDNLEVKKKETKKIEQKKFNSSENTEIQKIDLTQKPKKNITINENISDNTGLIEKSDTKKITLKEKKINKNDKIIDQMEKVETLKENKIKPKLKPKPKIKEVVESKSDIDIKNISKPLENIDKKNKIIDKPKPVKKPEPDLTMASIMKDLRNEETNNIAEIDNTEEDIVEQSEENDVNESNEISISERDLVLQQLNSCFSPRAGTVIDGEEYLKISVQVDKQAYVKTDTVQIIDTNISKDNPYYVAISESAKAIFYNPLCAKLKLPLNKYEEWKNLTINVDYSWMKN